MEKWEAELTHNEKDYTHNFRHNSYFVMCQN